MNVYKSILNSKETGKTLLAVLIDPSEKSKYEDGYVYKTIDHAIEAKADLFFIGGSSMEKKNMVEIIDYVKSRCTIPCILFPGSGIQIEESADALMLLSLISGRNADYLIGKHVENAGLLKRSGLEIIPTGYILVEGGKLTAVNYMTQTMPIPRASSELAVATALAGQMLGMKMIYLEAGSGALKAVNSEMINEVRRNITIPLIVGGGIKTAEDIRSVLSSGADMIVIGNALESKPEWIYDVAIQLRSQKTLGRV